MSIVKNSHPLWMQACFQPHGSCYTTAPRVTHHCPWWFFAVGNCTSENLEDYTFSTSLNSALLYKCYSAPPRKSIKSNSLKMKEYIDPISYCMWCALRYYIWTAFFSAGLPGITFLELVLAVTLGFFTPGPSPTWIKNKKNRRKINKMARWHQ